MTLVAALVCRLTHRAHEYRLDPGATTTRPTTLHVTRICTEPGCTRSRTVGSTS